jgi:hypothetical protein
MARMNQGILGSFTGKVGTVIGSSWKGKPFMKSLPGKRKGKPTQKQTEQQMKLAILSAFFNQLQTLLELTLSANRKKMSAVNYAVQINHKQAIIGQYPDYTIDYPKLVLSEGPLMGTETYPVASTDAGTIQFSWLDNTDSGNARETDQVILIAFCPEKFEYYFSTCAASRKDGSAMLKVPLFAGERVHTWMVFVSGDGKFYSEGLYRGEVWVKG